MITSFGPTARQILRAAASDASFSLRQMRRDPVSTAVIVLTLAIGIGANATMVGTIDRLLFRAPAGIRAPERVARLLVVSRGSSGTPMIGRLTNYPMLRDLEQGVPAFDAVAAYASQAVSLGVGPDAVAARAALVSATFFSVLGTTASVGRVFGPGDGYPGGVTPGGAPLVVLSDAFWRRHFAGSSAAIGKPLRIENLTYTVVGVAPRDFRGLETTAPDLWIPMPVFAGSSGSSVSLDDRMTVWLSVIARLKPGVSRAVAAQQADALWRRKELDTSGDSTARVVAASIIPGRSPDAPREVRVAVWLAGVSLLVLMIVGANVSSILLGRGIARRREFAIRSAMGASRARLARQTLVEGLLFATFGGTAAALFAATSGGLLRRLFVTELGSGGFVDGRLLLLTGLITAGTGVVVSLAPVLQTASGNLLSVLAGGTAAAGGRTATTRRLLLVVQAALCVIMLTGAGLFALSLRRVEGLDLGIDLDHTLVARFDMTGLAIPKQDIDTAYGDILRRVKAIPGVAGAAFASGNPYRGGRAVAAHPLDRDQGDYWHIGVAEIPMEGAVGSEYFRTVGANSLRGRDFDETDRSGSPRVAIINEPLAKILWPDKDALGQCVLLPVRGTDRGGECVTVVGVLRGFWKYNILNRDVLAVYVPLSQQQSTSLRARRPGSLYVRTSGDPAALVGDIRRAIQSVRADLPAVSVSTMASVVAPELRPWQLAATMFTLFGVIALVVAGIGLYAVVSFMVVQRTKEIAVRLALGARGHDIVRTVAADGLSAVVIGLATGSVVALLAARRVGPLLYQTSPYDSRTIVGGGAILLAVAVIAVAWPVRSALRQNPATALRGD